jgi:hypothetical protein
MNTDTIRKLLNCKRIIEGYGHFREGQDGYQALEIIEQELIKELVFKCPLGYCPHCEAPIIKSSMTVADAVICRSGHIIPKSTVRKF